MDQCEESDGYCENIIVETLPVQPKAGNITIREPITDLTTMVQTAFSESVSDSIEATGNVPSNSDNLQII